MQSNVIFAFIFIAYIFFITSRGELPTYLTILRGGGQEANNSSSNALGSLTNNSLNSSGSNLNNAANDVSGNAIPGDSDNVENLFGDSSTSETNVLDPVGF